MHREIERGDDVPWREKKGKRKAAEGKKTGGAKGGPTGASIEGKEGAPFALSRSHSFSPCPRERTRTHAPMPRAQRTLLSYHGRERLRRKKEERGQTKKQRRDQLSPLFCFPREGKQRVEQPFSFPLIFPFFFISLSRPPSLCVAGHRLRGSSHFCCSSRRSCPRRHASPTRSLRRWYVREERRGRERGREDIVRGVHFCEGRARGVAPCAV